MFQDPNPPTDQPAPRSVKPRASKYQRLPVVAIHNGMTLDENYELGTVEDLVAKLPKSNPTLFSMLGSADFVADLDAVYSLHYPTSWQWRTAEHERDIVRPDGRKVAARVSVVVKYFGWKNGNYHKIIDPVVMYGRELDDVWPARHAWNTDPLYKLLGWAGAIRDFCDDNGIEVRQTNGSIGSQFLTSSRFYDKPRRKVPMRTNEAVREHLPGNYYQLLAIPDRNNEHTAHYLDQRRAHHYHAANTRLPDSDHLYAYGCFTDLSRIAFPASHPDFAGLYCCDLEYKRNGPRAYSWIKGYSPKLERQFVWSNEIPTLESMGFRISGVRAAWGSRHADTGLGKYAKYAETLLDKYQDAPWLKPILLATYGVLATKPRYAEAVFRLAKGGTPVTMHTGRNKLSGLHTKAGKKLEPPIANVLHRGMIEAATRVESVETAHLLTGLGHRVLSIYADAIIVQHDEDRPLPPMYEPWRSKGLLNHLQFINQQAFTSGEMTKLPGVGREMRQYVQTRRPRAPRLINVAEQMEQDELVTQN